MAQDFAGNKNTAAPTIRVGYDGTVPTVEIEGAPGIVKNTDGFVVSFVFSEAVTGFDVGDITVVNGTASGFTTTNDAAKYGATITPDGNGDVEIKVASGVAQDRAGNKNTEHTVKVVYDVIFPTVRISGHPAIVANTDGFKVDVIFSEAVTGFDLSDITVVNGTASGFTVIDAAHYTAMITPDGKGTIEIKVAAFVAQDAAGN